MVINTSISMNTESSINIQEVFVSSETIHRDALKYPKGKTKLRL